MQQERRDEQAHGLLRLARHVAALKFVPRTGWLDRGVNPNRVESVADHSLGVALLAWFSALERQAEGATLDPTHVVMLALLHDLAEAETGDMPPYEPTALPGLGDPEGRRTFLEARHVRDDASSANKRESEYAAIQRLLADLPAATRSTVGELWEELQRGVSPEARFVKQVDRLETFLQSRHYLRDDLDLPMGSFQVEVVETIEDPLLGAIRDAALAGTTRTDAD
ncbi:MAG: HD domain-containing protein [Chloroflexota bacterium]|nr:HD domain-containing protein [Chloroflexia bacterium]MDQ3225045.1 HD domain-containing protein [Chloroflexota bacterium]